MTRDNRSRSVAVVAVLSLAAMGAILPAAEAQSAFTVQIDVQDHFVTTIAGVAGIGSENEIIEHKVIDEFGNETIEKIPGVLRVLDLTAERGLTSDLALASWRAEVEDGNIEQARANVVVTLLDEVASPVAAWSGVACWPTRLENVLPDPDLLTPVERLVVACDSWTRQE